LIRQAGIIDEEKVLDMVDTLNKRIDCFYKVKDFKMLGIAGIDLRY
jgi:hypothetical protein